MADTKDVILAMLDKQWSQAQQTESQRATMTNVVLLVFGGLQSLIVQRSFDDASLILSVTMVLVGTWGTLASVKYYERFRLSTSRVGRWMEKLEELDDSTQLAAIESRADAIHEDRYPRLHRIRLNWMWTWLHVAVIVGGVVNSAFILAK